MKANCNVFISKTLIDLCVIKKDIKKKAFLYELLAML